MDLKTYNLTFIRKADGKEVKGKRVAQNSYKVYDPITGADRSLTFAELTREFIADKKKNKSNQARFGRINFKLNEVSHVSK